VKASGIEHKARMIVKKLKFNKTIKANRQSIKEYKIARLVDILPEAIGRFFVRNTLASNSLSKISLTMHPADLINTDPRKKSIK
tara:strand:- start:47 stop:298 length:252 start_codon:yes stop_codon:yes gene_type:complete